MSGSIFILYVADRQRSRDFYRYVLDEEPLLDVPGMTEFRLAGDCRLGLIPEQGIARILGGATPHPSAGSGIPRCELYLRVQGAGDYLSRAVAAGAGLVSELLPRDWGEDAGYCSDPDGHILAFAEFREGIF